MAISRRAFVGGSALALGATATGIPRIADAAPAKQAGDDAVLGEPLLLRVVDPASDSFELLVGERAIPFRDPSLSNKIARLVRKEG